MAEDTQNPRHCGKAGRATAAAAQAALSGSPEINEVFTDSIRSCVFDGQVMRIEFTVSRFDDPGALGVLEGRQVPVARLVLNRTAIADLFNRLGQLSNALKQAGVGGRAGAPAAGAGDEELA